MNRFIQWDTLAPEVVAQRATLEAYYRLACQPELTETEADDMQAILDQASQDPLLSSLLDEVDHAIAHQLKLIDAGYVQDQQVKLQQAVDQVWIDLQSFDALTEGSPGSASSLRTAQTQLQAAGLYNGAIDGIYGPATQQAFQGLRSKLQAEFAQKGWSLECIGFQSQLMIDRLRSEGNHQEADQIAL
ncbi:MAG: peptidoglycan-binding domain-containing protein, partial [Synechococcales bacterium]|nr:peptidoglycan-binding domain-containing protein [Synechococcales bacterium]